MPLLNALAEVPVAIVLTLVAVRLLGARRSWIAIALAGLLGWLSANLLLVAMSDWDWDTARLSVATVSVSVVFTMLVAVALDFVARPGSLARGERAGLLVLSNPGRDLRRRLAPYARYRQILGIARRNGLLVGSARRRTASRSATPFAVAVRQALEEGGVVFVKLGQMASTRDDLLPAHLRAELSRLQGAVEPLGREPMQAHLEAELDGPVEQFFAEFDWSPIGSASIAQAYAARLATGEPVVVKVQRPGIEAVVERDTAALLHLARLVERRTPQGRDLRVAEIAEEFALSLRQELDFPLEAANAMDLASITDPASGVRIPHVYTALSTRRVLVLERFPGQSVARRERFEDAEADSETLVDRLVDTMVSHMLVHGHFHADPHPGNVFLLDDGSLGLIDFGSTGRLDPSQRAALLAMLVATANGDGVALRESIEAVATIGPETGDLELERALARFLGENVGPARSVAAAYNNLVPLLSTFDIRLPSELTVFFRALLLLDGTARTIHPGYSLVEAVPRRLDVSSLAPSAGGTVQEQLLHELLSQLPRLRRVPAHVDRIATLAARGDLRVRVGLFSTERDARVVSTLTNRLVLALVGGLLVVGSAILLTSNSASGADDGAVLLRVFGFIGLASASVILLRVVAAVVRDGYN